MNTPLQRLKSISSEGDEQAECLLKDEVPLIWQLFAGGGLSASQPAVQWNRASAWRCGVTEEMDYVQAWGLWDSLFYLGVQ